MQKFRIGYKQTAIALGDGTYADQTTLAPSSAVNIEGPVAVGTTSTQIAAANAARRWLYIQNNSETTFWLKSGAAAALNQGWELQPGDTILYQHALAVYAIGSSAGSLQVLEETF